MAKEQNPAEYLKESICPGCAWHNWEEKETESPYLPKILDYLTLQDAGCPLGRYELSDIEWRMLGIIKSAREQLIHEEAEQRTGDGSNQ